MAILQWRSAPEILIGGQNLAAVISSMQQDIKKVKNSDVSFNQEWLGNFVDKRINISSSNAEMEAMKVQVSALWKYIETLQRDFAIVREDVVRAAPLMIETITETTDGEKLEAVLNPLFNAMRLNQQNTESLRSDLQDTQSTVFQVQAELARAQMELKSQIVQATTTHKEQLSGMDAVKMGNLRAEVSASESRGEIRMQETMNEIRQEMRDFKQEIHAQLDDIGSSAEFDRALDEKMSVWDHKLTTIGQGQELLEQGRRDTEAFMSKTRKKNEKIDQALADLQSFQEEHGVFEEKVAEKFSAVEQDVVKRTEELQEQLDFQAAALEKTTATLREEDGQLVDRLEETKKNLSLAVARFDKHLTNLDDLVIESRKSISSHQISIDKTSDQVVELVGSTTERFESLRKDLMTKIETQHENFTTKSEELRARVKELGQIGQNSNEKLAVEFGDFKSETETAMKEYKATHGQAIMIQDALREEMATMATALDTIEANASARNKECVLALNESSKLTRELMTSVEHSEAHVQTISDQQQEVRQQLETFRVEISRDLQDNVERMSKQVMNEAMRTEALYESFLEKQEHFSRVIALSSIRNMSHADLLKELDNLRFKAAEMGLAVETPKQAKAKKYLFGERVQQQLVKHCQNVAELLVARAEFEGLRSAITKQGHVEKDIPAAMKALQFEAADQWVQQVLQTVSGKSSELHDQDVLTRRAAFHSALRFLLHATIERRTLGSVIEAPSEASFQGDFSKTNQGVVGQSTKSASDILTQKSYNFGPSVPLNEVMPMLAASENSMRPMRYPDGAPHVYRGGFKFPATPKSNPTSLRPLTKQQQKDGRTVEPEISSIDHTAIRPWSES